MKETERLHRNSVVKDLTRTLVNKDTRPTEMVKGVVTDFSSGVLTMSVSGGLATITVPYLSGYSPAIDDVVWAAKTGPFLLVLGKELGGTPGTDPVVTGDIGQGGSGGSGTTPISIADSATASAILQQSSGILYGPQAFTGTNGAALPSEFTGSLVNFGAVGSGGRTNIQSNTMSLKTNNGQGYTNIAQALLSTGTFNVANAIYTGKFKAISSGEQYFVISTRASGGLQTNNITPVNGYTLELDMVTTGFYVKRYLSSAVTELSGFQGFTFTSGTFYQYKFETTGTTIRVKLWTDGGSEPGTWTWSGTDSGVTGAGTLYYALLNSTALLSPEFQIDDVQMA